MAPSKILSETDPKYQKVKIMMDATIRNHAGSPMCKPFTSYQILKIQEIFNDRLKKGFKRRRRIMNKFNNGEINEKWLFHGTPEYSKVLDIGFQESLSKSGRQMYGKGIYFADDSSKSNQYVHQNHKCPRHDEVGCYECFRYLLLCRVLLGRTLKTTSQVVLENLPVNYDSITAEPSNNLRYKEYVIRRGDQTYPTYLIKYLMKP